MTARKAAKRPVARTVSVSLGGEYEGWECTAKADFPARVLERIQSDQMTDIMAALDSIVIEHNFPDENDKVAASMSDVDPIGGVIEAASAIMDAIGKLPNR